MIIDTHAHYEPRLLPLERMRQDMEHYGISKMVLIPYLTNPPEGVKPSSLMAIQRLMLSYDYLRPVAIAMTKMMYKREGEWNLRGLQYLMRKKVQNYEIVSRPDNQSIVDLVRRDPERFMGWIFVNPALDDAVDELKKFAREPGMIGVKLHPFWHRFSIRSAKKIFDYAQQQHFLVNIHLGFDECGDYRWILNHYPKLKVVFAHLGVPYYKSLWHAIKNRDNVFMDMASTYHVDRRLIQSALKIVGPHRIFFGTDTPYTGQGSVPTLISWIREAALKESEQRAIFCENFMKAILR